MNNKRKLMGKELLKEVIELRKLGVPIRRIIKNKKIDISIPHLNKLMDLYEEANITTVSFLADSIFSSIFPIWLSENDGIKIVPNNWHYKGRFPFGIWEQINEIS